MTLRTAIPLILLLIVAGVIPAEASFDLSVSRIDLEPVDPNVGFTSGGTSLTVTVTPQAKGDPFPSGLNLSIRHNGALVYTSMLSAPLAPILLTRTVALGDTISAEIDVHSDDVLPENNALQLSIGTSGSFACGKYPYSITFDDPEDPNKQDQVTLEWAGECDAAWTQPFPFAMLIPPPFDVATAVPGQAMITSFLQETTSTVENETTSGVTTGGMVEVGVDLTDPLFGIGVKMTWGEEIETAVENTIGRAIERTYSRQFDLTLYPDSNQSFWDHAVLVQQTYIQSVKYVITAAHVAARVGNETWIGVPEDPGQGRYSPALSSISLTEYNEYKSPGAMALGSAGHVIGIKSTYPTDDNPGTAFDHQAWHITEPINNKDTSEHNCIEVPQIFAWRIAEEGALIGSGASQTWSQTHEEGQFVSQTVTESSTQFLTGEVSGGALTFATGTSFGTFQGASHRFYHGYRTGYEWTVGPVLSFADKYWVTALTTRLEVHCINDPAKPVPQRVLLVDYYVPPGDEAVSGSSTIPTLSTIPMLILVGLLALLGTMLLRRRVARQS